jgi:hypothetical protein
MAGGMGPADRIQELAGDQGKDWNNCISAHPTNQGMAALGWQKGPFLTLDSGKTWRLIDGHGHLHADLHAFHFTKEVPDSIGNLFVGSDGGVALINLDDFLGMTGQPFRSDHNRNMPTLQCYSTLIRQFYGTMDASASIHGLIIAGLQDNGNVLCMLRPSPAPWRHVDGGDGGWNAFLTDGSFAHNQKGEAIQVSSQTTAGVVTAVVPVTNPLPGDPAGIIGPAGEAIAQPLHRNPMGQLLSAVAAVKNVVYGLYKNTFAVPPYHWEVLGVLPASEIVEALGSFDGGRVFAGTLAGRIYVLDTATGGVVAQKINLPQPSPGTVMQGGAFKRIVGFSDTAMFASLLNAVEAKIGGTSVTSLPIINPVIQNYVLRLDGDTWVVTDGVGLPNEFMYGMVAVSAPNTRIPHGLLVSTDDAVYLSRDDGQSWMRAALGLPRRAHCGDLRFATDSAEGGDIYLGTFGRSIWTARLGSTG